METKDLDVQALEKASPIIEVALELGIKVQGSMGTCFKQDNHVADDGKPTLFFNPERTASSAGLVRKSGGRS